MILHIFRQINGKRRRFRGHFSSHDDARSSGKIGKISGRNRSLNGQRLKRTWTDSWGIQFEGKHPKKSDHILYFIAASEEGLDASVLSTIIDGVLGDKGVSKEDFNRIKKLRDTIKSGALTVIGASGLSSEAMSQLLLLQRSLEVERVTRTNCILNVIWSLCLWRPPVWVQKKSQT